MVNWSWILFIIMAGLRASCCPLLTTGSMAWKVDSVALRPLRPASNFMVGVQDPKSRPAMVEAWKPAKFPVTAFVTAPAPATAVELDPEAAAPAATDAVATEAADEVA